MVTLGDKGLLVRIHAGVLETRLRVRAAKKNISKSLLILLFLQKSILNRSFGCGNPCVILMCLTVDFKREKPIFFPKKHARIISHPCLRNNLQ